MNKFFLIFCFATVLSCGDRENDNNQLVVDNNKVHTELKGQWKIDFHTMQYSPETITSNMYGCYIKINDDGKISYKDSYTTLIDQDATYYKNGSNNAISINSNEIHIESYLSSKKPGYTEFWIYYASVPASNNVLYGKKQ
jgi:hypothetical protein